MDFQPGEKVGWSPVVTLLAPWMRERWSNGPFRVKERLEPSTSAGPRFILRNENGEVISQKIGDKPVEVHFDPHWLMPHDSTSHIATKI